MKVKFHQVNRQGHLETLGDEELSASWPEDEVSRWVDIESAEPEKLERLLAPLDLHPMVLENCLSQSSAPRVISYERAVVVDIPIFASHESLTQSYLSIICLPTTLITLHREPLLHMMELTE